MMGYGILDPLLSDAQDLDRIRIAFDRDQTVLVNLRKMALAYITFFLEHPEYFEKLSWFYLPGREQRLAPDVLERVNLLCVTSQFVASHLTCLKFHLHYFISGEFLKDQEQRPQRIAVRHDKHRITLHNNWQNVHHVEG